MKVIDAQIHIWAQTVTPPSGLHRKVPKFTAEEALKEMDEAGVDAALIHPPYSWDPTSNQLALDAAKKYPDRFAVMGQFPLDDPESRKRIHGFAGQAPADASPSCASWEVDQAVFVPIARAREMLHPAQAPLLDRLEELLKAS